MINLLPDSDKKQIRAGRVNSIIIRYVVAVSIILCLIAVEFGGTYFYIENVKQQATAAISENEIKSADLLTKQKDITAFRQNLATTKQILDKQVNYSQIILRVASEIPGGVIVDQLDLNSTEFGKPTTLNVHAKNEAATRALKQALNDSPYFENVYFNTITIDSNSLSPYPYSVTLSLTYTKDLTK